MTGIARVSKIILILTGLIRERELERGRGQSLRNSREVCPPENIFVLNWDFKCGCFSMVSVQ